MAKAVRIQMPQSVTFTETACESEGLHIHDGRVMVFKNYLVKLIKLNIFAVNFLACMLALA